MKRKWLYFGLIIMVISLVGIMVTNHRPQKKNPFNDSLSLTTELKADSVAWFLLEEDTVKNWQNRKGAAEWTTQKGKTYICTFPQGRVKSSVFDESGGEIIFLNGTKLQAVFLQKDVSINIDWQPIEDFELSIPLAKDEEVTLIGRSQTEKETVFYWQSDFQRTFKITLAGSGEIQQEDGRIIFFPLTQAKLKIIFE